MIRDFPVPHQRGHFALESGLHTDTWLDLDSWFLKPSVMEGPINELASRLESQSITAVCGPLIGGAFVAQSVAIRLKLRFYYTEHCPSGEGSGLFRAAYRLPQSMRMHAARERFAVVDDAISAGSSTRATIEELESTGAKVAVVGALLLLGEIGARFFSGHGVPLVSVLREELAHWEPQECPLCASGVPLTSFGATDRVCG